MGTKFKFLLSITFIISFSYTIFVIFHPKEVKESLTYFPPDPSLTFSAAESKLTLLNEKDNDEYIVEWELLSKTDQKVYLRQDISFLFIDGLLVDILSEWKEGTDSLKQKKKLRGEDSSLYQSISLHHGEVHLKDDVIKSAQLMTGDNLYVIDSSFTPLESFRHPKNKEQEEWKKILDHVIAQHLQYSWNELVKHFNINKENYYELTMLDLLHYNVNPLPGLTKESSEKVMGQLWEGLYKNYFLGISLSEEETISPIGSKLPLLLLSKDRSHLLILIEGKQGEKIKLIQEIE